jgi:hypothetical protein
MRTSRFDVVTAFLTSLIVFAGTCVLLLIIAWFTNKWVVPPRSIDPIIEHHQGLEYPNGFERDFEPPGREEVEDLIEASLPDTIEAVTNSITNVAASLETVDSASTVATDGKHVGDPRMEGPGQEEDGQDVIPRYLRWQLDFAARDMTSYAKQLDYFKIELAVIGGTIQGVDVVNELATGPKHYRIVDTTSESRLYFMWVSPGPLLQFDRRLLQQCGVPFAGRQILKFIPKDLENETLATLELEFARSKGYQSVTQIAKTVFVCEPEGAGYRFVVTSQRYRKGK